MDLSRNLPLTRSVLKATLQDATPGQLGLLASLFKAENASREQSRRLRLLKHAVFPRPRSSMDTIGARPASPRTGAGMTC